MPDRILDLLVGKTIFIPTGLMPLERAWRVAHCLGHYFLHSGNQVWCDSRSRALRMRQEHQADAFAAAPGDEAVDGQGAKAPGPQMAGQILAGD